MSADLELVREEWVGVVFERDSHDVDEASIIGWASSCGERDPRFTDPTHEDFQAHPTFLAHFNASVVVPNGFPTLAPGPGIDGGKRVESHHPVRPGDRVESRASVADVYLKTGRSGSMFFVVQRVEFLRQDGTPLTTVDTRFIWPVPEETSHA